jgi:hypothetical protein
MFIQKLVCICLDYPLGIFIIMKRVSQQIDASVIKERQNFVITTFSATYVCFQSSSSFIV